MVIMVAIMFGELINHGSFLEVDLVNAGKHVDSKTVFMYLVQTLARQE